VKTLALAILLLPAMQEDEEALRKKHAEVTQFLKTAKTEREFRAAASDLAKLAQAAMNLRKYDLAAKVCSDAERACRAIPDPAQAQEHQDAARRMTEIAKEFLKAAKAVDRIIAKQGTPEDYLASGKFFCFVLGEWGIGIEDLSKSKDPALQKLAESDLVGTEPLSIGDAWAARKEPLAKERALWWYAKEWPKLTGIAREKLRSKVKALTSRGPSREGAVPTGWKMDAKGQGRIFIDESVSKSGRRSVCLTPTSTSTIWWTPFKPFPPGTYTMSAWVLPDGTEKETEFFNFKAWDASDKAIWPILKAPADFPFWTKVEQTFEIPPGAKQSHIYVLQHFAEGRVWIDDLSIRDKDGTEYVENGGVEK